MTQDTRNWYVGIVGYNSEKKAAERLQECGYTTYVPLQETEHHWRNGQTKTISRTVIPSVVFILATPEQQHEIANSVGKDMQRFVKHFMRNTAGTPNKYGVHPVAIIPAEQIEQLKFMLFQSENPVELSPTPLRRGDKVRVLRGKLKGLEGFVQRNHPTDADKIFISLSVLGFATTKIDRDSLEII